MTAQLQFGVVKRAGWAFFITAEKRVTKYLFTDACCVRLGSFITDNISWKDTTITQDNAFQVVIESRDNININVREMEAILLAF